MRKFYDSEPSYEPPAVKELPLCPVCGCEAETFYRNSIGEILGCDVCITAMDAWEMGA